MALSFPFRDDGVLPWPARGCSLGAALLRLRNEYSLLSWSHWKPVDVEFVLSSWAADHDIEAIPQDGLSGFWRSSVSQRELWSTEHYDGLGLDVRAKRLRCRDSWRDRWAP
ncbi:unnamed protein product [Durusdinium trenchii]|uniref:Uncharacterized protein n=1 Tax=Durusdinium trenchii TaxID=1381693 RepID=A0ABP0J7C2_9DINO